MNAGTQGPIGVCFISPGIYPLFNPSIHGVLGGAQVDIYMIASELAMDKRFCVSIITDHFDQSGVEAMDNLIIYKTPKIQNVPLRSSRALWKSMGKANASIYFAKGASLTTALVALFCHIGRRVFILRTSSDFECDGSYLRTYPLKGKCFLWSLKVARQVIVQNTAGVSKLKQSMNVDAVALANGHRIPGFQDNPREFILWVGRIADVKQPRLFFQLAQEFPCERFVMICQARRGDRRYEGLIDEASGIDNLQFIKSVPFHEIGYYFRQAKVLVNTSRSEGFPNAFIQAGAYGATILSLQVNPDGFLDRFNCGLCACGDWVRFVDSLKYLLHEDQYKRMGEKARKYVGKNHEISTIIEQYKDYFMKSMEPKRI